MLTFELSNARSASHYKQLSDDQLARRVQIFLAARIGHDRSRLRVHVERGRVLLFGVVATRGQREIVEACSRRVAGVLDVTNNLSVRSSLFQARADDHVTRRRKIVRKSLEGATGGRASSPGIGSHSLVAS
jgi:hypothetical protein